MTVHGVRNVILEHSYVLQIQNTIKLEYTTFCNFEGKYNTVEYDTVELLKNILGAVFEYCYDVKLKGKITS